MKNTRFLSLFAFAVLLSTAMLPKSAFAVSSVSDDGAAANTLVSVAATAAAATQTGGIIASAVGSAIGGGGAPVGAPTGSLDSRTLSRSVAYFNSRDIAAKAGKSAGSGPVGGLWLQGAYTAVDNDEAGGKFDGDIINFLAGVDFKPKRFNGNMVVGLALSYENVDIDTAFNNGTFEGEGVSIVPYVGYNLNKTWTVDAAVGVGFISYDNSRTSNAVRGEFDALRYFGMANLTGNFRKKKWRFSPKIGILGLQETQDNYIETGTSTAAVGRSFIHLVRINAGGEVGYQMKKMEPFAHFTAQFDPDRNAPVTLTNNQVASDDDLGATLGAGINFYGSGRTSGNIKYSTTQFKNDITTHSISGRVRFTF